MNSGQDFVEFRIDSFLSSPTSDSGPIPHPANLGNPPNAPTHGPNGDVLEEMDCSSSLSGSSRDLGQEGPVRATSQLGRQSSFPCPLCPAKIFHYRTHLSRHIREKHADCRIEHLHACGNVQFISCQTCRRIFLKSNGRVPKHKCQLVLNNSQQVYNGAAAVAPSVPQLINAVPNPMETVSLLTDYDQLSDLMGKYQRPLSKLSQSWRVKFAQISYYLLLQLSTAESDSMLHVLAAFLILPGLIATVIRQHGSAKQLLGRIMSAEQKARFILLEADALSKSSISLDYSFHTEDNYSRLVRQANQLALSGRLSSATAVVERLRSHLEGDSPLERPTTDHICEIISNLHPPGTEEDILEPSQLTLDTPEITAEMVLKMGRHLDRGAAHGPSGWTNIAVQAVILHGGEDSATQIEHASAIAAFFNRCYRGQLPLNCCQLWSTARAVLIPKADGSWRPLGIGEGWYRFLAKIIASSLVGAASDGLSPLQLACGVPGGSEFAAHAAQTAWEMGHTGPHVANYGYISLDIRNAFNSLRRSIIQKGIRERLPILEPWFQSFYGQPSLLRLGDGQVVGQSSTGVRQGDPLAMLCFCLGFHDVVQNIDHIIHERIPGPCGVISYADDILVHGDIHLLNECSPQILDAVSSIGLTVNIMKCKIVGLQAYSIENPIFPTADNHTHMGNPVGDPGSRRAKVEEMVREAAFCLPLLPQLHAQAAYLILKHCIHNRPLYLTRVSGLSIAGPVLEDFDDIIQVCLSEIVRSTDEELMLEGNELKELPARYGGLGLPRLSTLAGMKAEIQSQLAFKEFASICCRDLLPAIHPICNPIVAEMNAELAQVTSDSIIMEEDQGTCLRERLIKQQKMTKSAAFSVIDKIYKTKSQEYHQRLLESNRQGHAAWYLSGCSPGGSRWTSFLSGNDPRFHFESEEFVDALRNRLLLPAVLDTVDITIQCQCKQRVNINSIPLHLLNCECVSRLKTIRHSQILHAVAQAIHATTSRRQVTIAKEVSLEHPDGGLRADLKIIQGAKVTYLDITVVNPSSNKYLMQGAAEKADKAGEIAYDMKIKKYNDKFPGINIVPVVIESGGRIHRRSMEWIEKFFRDGTYHRSRLLDLINVITARANSRILATARRFCMLH